MIQPSRRLRTAAPAAVALAVLATPLVLVGPASASATSHEIAYTADDNNDGIYSVVLRDLESRAATTVLPASTNKDEDWIYDDPELSPDGSRIALSTDRAAQPFAEYIAVVNRDGTGLRRLTSPASTEQVLVVDVSAAWSPDGRTLLFTRLTVDNSNAEAPKESSALWTVPAAGGTASPLRGGENGYTADWSPDGSRIVFASVPPDSEGQTPDSGPLLVVNADGTGGATALGPTGLMPAWSPDGGSIAFATVTARDSDRDRAFDTTRLATVPATGGAARVLAATQPSNAPSVAEYPSWAPDGRSILYDVFGYSATTEYPPGDLWAIDSQGVRAGKVTATGGDEAQVSVQGPAPGVVSAGAGSTFTAVTPKRILDTRGDAAVGGPTGKVAAGGTLRLPVRGVQTAQGAVPANASAVVLNVTVTGTTAGTDVRAYPSGTGVPLASNLNAQRGSTVPNLVTVRVGDDGAIVLRNSGGTVHLIADLAGWYTPDSAGTGFAAVDPSRIMDTRTGVNVPAGKLGARGTVDLQVTGSLRDADGRTLTVPADAKAVVLNVTATAPTSSTDVRVYPSAAGGAVPQVSNLNVRRGQTAPNLVTVAVGAAGKVRLRNEAGDVHLIADLAGYYAPGAAGRFVPVVPTRFLDTRSGVGGAPIATSAQGFVDLAVGGTRGVPSGATAAVLNLTGTGVAASTDVRAYPSGAAQVPTVSNLNVVRGDTRANLTIVRVGPDGQLRVRNNAGSVQLIGDLAGYVIG